MNRRPIKPTLHAEIPQLDPQPSAPPPATLRRETPAELDRSEREPSVVQFRPVQRPPMAMIELLDDGGEHGEEIRIRSDIVTIGRTAADIAIPHDSQISGNHVRISRRLVNSEYHWFLTDLSSTNGTFLRVSRSLLQSAASIIIGSHRYGYRPAATSRSSEPTGETSVGTRGWKAPSTADLKRLTAALVRIATDGTEIDFPLPDAGARIGSDSSQCQIVISDDPTVNPVHAVIQLTDKGLMIEDRKSVNGLWTAVSERRLGNTATFQIGEQRIRFRVL